MAWLVGGLQDGFRLGYQTSRSLLKPAKRNIPSAHEHPEVVDAYLAAEVQKGRVLGPFPRPPINPLHISRFGVIPKKSQPGKWRLIVDLSFPEGRSVNDGIPKEICSLRYPTIDLAIGQILQLGAGTQLSKLDIKDAYRIVPVHPQDWELLGLVWKGSYYIDTRLPFGLRSAPKIFTALADAAQWLIMQRGAGHCLHYLDDFLFLEPPEAVATALEVASATLAELGIPLAPGKLEGPTTKLTFLGIELDTSAMIARLPEEKVLRIKALLDLWQDRKACTKRDLLSLLGVLQHAAMIVQYGRTFVRRIIELSKVVNELHHFVRLNREFRSDLHWWKLFISRWNGVSFLMPAHVASPSTSIYSDASGSWGFGAWCDSSLQWFQGSWPPNWQKQAITAKELLPIAIAAAVWGPKWSRLAVRFWCDNASIVQVIASRKSNEPLVMHLLRGLHLLAMEFHFVFSAAHIAGKDNGPADALSRNSASSFHMQVPMAPKEPTPLPPDLIQLFLATPPPDWLSSSWRQLLTTTLGRASHTLLPRRIAQASDNTMPSAN